MGLNVSHPGEEGIPRGSVPAKPVLSSGIFFVSQSAADIGQIQELQLQLEEAKKEKHKLQEQVRAGSCPVVGEEEKGSLWDLTLWAPGTVVHSASVLRQMNWEPS